MRVVKAVVESVILFMFKYSMQYTEGWIRLFLNNIIRLDEHGRNMMHVAVHADTAGYAKQ